MSQQFLDTEGPGWVDRGIISPEQLRQLRALYPEEQRTIGLLPLLGSLLVALSALSVVAANWQDLPEALRLALLLGALTGAYAAGEYFLARGYRGLGIGLVGLGLGLFGASIVLTSQLYQLIGYDATGLLAWVVAGVLLTYVYQSRTLLLLTVGIAALAQGYSVGSLSTFSYATAALTAGGLGYYWWRRPDGFCGAVLSTGLLWQAALLVQHLHIKITWFFVPAMLVYALGDWQPHRPAARAWQAPPLVAAFLFTLGLAMFGEGGDYTRELRPQPLGYLGALLLVLLISVAGKRARGRLTGTADWLLLLPGYYFPGGLALAVATLVVLYAYSGAVLYRGFREQAPERVNLGTVLFVLTTMVAYFKLTWGFLDKSLFFLLGGALLLGLSWYLRRQARSLPPTDQPPPAKP
ncbi:DUF2157 domain-containing protein [Hymenobacter gummosus]|uniref:DUF2157 domain-containing protein n=1 Tax=Hymenobacter gummosus TaxID=1776032 RepID=A0A431TZ00_9BACT|nr:DUF2157 domain-containing protein [Hymenobacter gummosus]RTQ47104.1 DUF2157 domain-containing protein [Hymenobacter gummosus]